MPRNPSTFATCSSLEPGSVMAMKRLPAASAPTARRISSKKNCLRMFGSSVEPDLLATTTKVSPRFTSSHAAFTCAGSVESTMRSSGNPGRWPKVLASTSGHKLEPPMPSSTTDWKSELSTSPPSSAKAGRSFCWRSTMSIQPIHCSSPSRVHRLGSFCQKRSTLWLACQSAAAASTAPRRSEETAIRKLISP